MLNFQRTSGGDVFLVRRNFNSRDVLAFRRRRRAPRVFLMFRIKLRVREYECVQELH
jgi:hypothetical protein